MLTKLEKAREHIANGKRKSSRAAAWAEAHLAWDAAECQGQIPTESERPSWPDFDEIGKVVTWAQAGDPWIIVTRHAGLVAWLEKWHKITGEPVAHISDPEQIAGRIVVGALPFHLAAVATRVGVVDMPGLRADQRGQDLTVEDMESAGAVLRWYSVKEI